MRILKSRLCFTAVVAALLAGVNSTRAAVILSETFETPAVGDAVTTANSIFGARVSSGDFTVQNDTGSGAFTGSQFMRYIDTSSIPRLRATFAPITGVFQVSWDYFEPKAFIEGSEAQFRVLLSSGDAGTQTNRAVDLLLQAPNDGTATTGQVTNWDDGFTNLAAFATDTLAHFKIVGNVGASTTYAGGDLPTQTFDFYFNGVLTGNNLTFRGPNSGSDPMTQIDELAIGYPSGSGSTRFQTAFIDNIVLEDAIGTPGDFDGDGDVDGADFVAWQTNFPTATGATLDKGDADGDGDVDGADFVVWQTNFPFTPGSAASPVPEPQSCLLLAIGAAVAMGWRSARR